MQSWRRVLVTVTEFFLFSEKRVRFIFSVMCNVSYIYIDLVLRLVPISLASFFLYIKGVTNEIKYQINKMILLLRIDNTNNNTSQSMGIYVLRLYLY